MSNPLFRESDIAFLLHDVLHAEELTRLAPFTDHDRSSFDMTIESARRFARNTLLPTYKPTDEEPPRLTDGKVLVHPRLKAIYGELAALGLVVAGRPPEVGGQHLPRVVHTFATAYLMAANLGAYGYVGLAAGAAHLLETFGSPELRATYMTPIYEGRWLGTMALTEPQAGSSLADVATRATPTPDGSYRIKGAKIFISGGDHDLTENIVHMVLARIDGAPPGTKGVSLFCVPKRRVEGTSLVDNDVAVAGMIHKIGWRALPSLALAFGDRGDCHGWLVGQPHRGLNAMFQMMNEARIMVGMNGVATASVAYHESLAYALERTQGRPVEAKDPTAPQVPIVEHADVRRMLLRQKAIVEGGLCLIGRTAIYADLAEHAPDASVRARAQRLLDLLTPVAKSFPAERGFEANALAIQIHGGYGYTSEYVVEALMRDQKLNSIHEGTTGIQGLDLLGRKVVADGGAGLVALREEITATAAAARTAGIDERLVVAVTDAVSTVESLTAALAAKGLGGDVGGMLLHSSDYLELFGILVIAWQHLAMAAAANTADQDFNSGKRLSAEYWIATEIPRLTMLAELCRSGEDSYRRVRAREL
ncbi:MAG: acyl-CoA dehydrogenase [Deltaproteobacteria bacterium]|nr:acyl-CoA dehydrogenase [Deltaproteobacteria bacterium]